MQRLACIMHSYRLAAITIIAAGLYECMIHTKRCI